MKRLRQAIRRLVSSLLKRSRQKAQHSRKEGRPDYASQERRPWAGEEQRQDTEQLGPATCAFLNVPVEITLLIAAKLPLYSQLLLSQTCSAMRTLLRRDFALDHISWGRYFSTELLSCIARQRPEHWACWRCRCLHRVDYDDAPASPALRLRVCKSRPGEVFGVRMSSPFRIFHCHVQLALKYARLAREGVEDEGGRRQRHLERIMQPFHGAVKVLPSPAPLLWYSIFPRLVEERFMVLSVWSFDDDSIEVSHKSNFMQLFVPLCPHRNYHDLSWSMRRRRRGMLVKRRASCGKAVKEPTLASPLRVEVRDSCSSCCTDFALQGSSMCSILRCWQDLGPEASARNRTWRARADMTEMDAPRVYHEPGSVRALYESVDARIEPEEDETTASCSSLRADGKRVVS